MTRAAAAEGAALAPGRDAAPARTGSVAPVWAVALALFAWLAASAGWRPLMLPDEGRYAGVAWEMLRSGQWAVPTLDGLPFFHKPPLFYWLSAGAMQLFGAHPWAARMPSLLGGLLGAMALYLFTRRWQGEPRARWALLVLATQPFFYAGAQFANLDMLVAGCIGATVLLGAHAALLAAEGRPHRGPLLAAYAMAAVGMLAKGLIGFVLPGATLLLWLLASRRPALVWRLVSLPGLLLFLLLALPWFVAMQARYAGFFDYFVVYHHFKRFAEAGFNNQQPFWFYLPVVLGLALPWTLALRAAWRQREPASALPSVRLLMLCWMAVVLVFFSLPRSKLVGYVLPALPPLAWWLSGAFVADGGWARRRTLLAGVAALSCLAVVGAVAMAHLRSDAPLGLALRHQRQAGEPVVFVGRYPYDLPFYARLETPAQVLDEWQSPAIPKHDDWRKELYDAAQFDPVLGRHQLIGHEALPALLCAHERSWIVASDAQRQAAPALRGAHEVARVKDVALWSLPRPALNCRGTPSGG
jgi:4-amino-4-deoxy-L-arabinose transferase-like glycosyltransferase